MTQEAAQGAPDESPESFEGVVSFPRTEKHKKYQAWRQKMRQRAMRRLATVHSSEFEKYFLEEQVADWENRPDPDETVTDWHRVETS